MSDAFDVRRLAPADLPAYKALRDATLALHVDAFTSDAETERHKAAVDYLPRLGLDRPEGGHFTWGAFAGASLIGAISCERERRRKVRHIGHVTGVMVHADARGQGVGRALMRACIAAARAADGLELLTLSVSAGNVAALTLYESSGFIRHGTLRHALKIGTTYLDKHLMSMDL